jgi:hypothetical protein
MSRRPLPGAHGPGLRAQMHAETVGPFRLTTDDAGTTWLRLHDARDPWRAWSPASPLTPERMRDFVRAIDAAKDRTTLARLAHILARRYAGDPCTGALADWMKRRGHQLRPPRGSG